MSVTDASLAALLLTNRLVDTGEKPLSASEFWALVRTVDDPSTLVGQAATDLADLVGVSIAEAERYAALLGATTAFAFERERLEEEGVRLVSALDNDFPTRLRERLGDACPAFLLIGGPAEFLSLPSIGVVGSRDASPAALEVATAAGKVASAHTIAVVSGLARGIDQTAMAGALDAGAPVVGVPSEGIRVAARNAEVRRRVHDGELCIASPYAPGMRFTAGNAMGRNKIIYALSDVTLVVCSDSGTGGTWEGAREALRRRFGRVAVWTGDGAGPGNAQLVELGAIPVDDLGQLTEIPSEPITSSPPKQPSLFDDV